MIRNSPAIVTRLRPVFRLYMLDYPGTREVQGARACQSSTHRIICSGFPSVYWM